jgi:hypothetical protein
MTSMMKTMIRLAGVLALAVTLATLPACDDDTTAVTGGGPDMAMMTGGSVDMAQPACIMNPTTSDELLNACTTAQTGDPAKDAPYYPTLAPNGNLPPLP